MAVTHDATAPVPSRGFGDNLGSTNGPGSTEDEAEWPCRRQLHPLALQHVAMLLCGCQPHLGCGPDFLTMVEMLRWVWGGWGIYSCPPVLGALLALSPGWHREHSHISL